VYPPPGTGRNRPLADPPKQATQRKTPPESGRGFFSIGVRPPRRKQKPAYMRILNDCLPMKSPVREANLGRGEVMGLTRRTWQAAPKRNRTIVAAGYNRRILPEPFPLANYQGVSIHADRHIDLHIPPRLRPQLPGWGRFLWATCRFKIGHCLGNHFWAANCIAPRWNYSKAGEAPIGPPPKSTCRASELERPQCNCPAPGPFLLGLRFIIRVGRLGRNQRPTIALARPKEAAN
jgi:hypothetical protein